MNLDREDLCYIVDLLEFDLSMKKEGLEHWQSLIKIKIRENEYIFFDEMEEDLNYILFLYERIKCINRLLNKFKL